MVHGDGNQTRDYVYVDDVMSAMVAASTAPNVDGLVINVGSGVQTSLSISSRLFWMDRRLSLRYLDNSKNSRAASRMAADLTIAQDKLSYHPSIKLGDGLRLTLHREPTRPCAAISSAP